MQQYLNLLGEVLATGTERQDRTGVGTLGVFGRQMRFDLGCGFSLNAEFPLLTTKRVFWKGVVAELLWLISGSTNIRPLVQQGVSIWTDWPLKNHNKWRSDNDLEAYTKAEFEERICAEPDFTEKWGNLGPVYGKQWRNWDGNDFTGSIDQLQQAIDTLRSNPDSRRIIVTAWNPAEIDDMALPPCHLLFQFNSRLVNGRRVLDCQLYQRSCDLFLGVPFNIASYSLLTLMVAQITGHEPGEFIWTGGDCHVYLNHIEQVKEQLGRAPRDLPYVRLNPAIREIDDFTASDITLHDYAPHGPIKAEVAV